MFFERHQQKVAEMHASFSATTVMDEKTEKVTFWVMCFLFILLGYFSGRERTFAYKSHWFRNYYHNLESNKFSSSISYGPWDLIDLNPTKKLIFPLPLEKLHILLCRWLVFWTGCGRSWRLTRCWQLPTLNSETRQGSPWNELSFHR